MALVAASFAPQSGSERKRRRRRRRGAQSTKRGFVLKAVEGPLHGKEFSFESAATIGRIEENDIVVLDPGISRRHARLYEHLGVFMLEDNGSANGTVLNGQRIDGSEVLREGDLITVSHTTFRFSQLDVGRGEITKQIVLKESALNDLDVSGTSEVAQIKAGFARRWRLPALVTLGVLMVSAGLAYLYTMRDSRVANLSEEPIRYDEADFAGNVLGFGEYDQTHPEGVVVDFGYLGGRVTLQLGAWGIEQADEVEMLLNGTSVGHLPVTMQRWVYGIKIELPREKLKEKELNRLVFKAHRNPSDSDPWEIYDLHIIQDPIPPPDEQQAYREYERGKKIWEDRQVEPGNMYEALSALKKARSLLEGLSEKPKLYEVIRTFIERIESELTTKFDEGLFTAHRLQRVDRDLGRAAEVLEQTMRYFGRSDYRYRELERFLKALEAQREF
jgi:pSer/pThr/pTyr-binding forkhead associated (FHA) protein